MSFLNLKRWQKARVWERIKVRPDRKKFPKVKIWILGVVALLAIATAVAVRVLVPSFSVGEAKPINAVFKGQKLTYWQEHLTIENYAPGQAGISERAAINIRRISGGIEPLYWVDFNDSEKLCGLRGCLYAVYRASGQRLLAVYVRLPSEGHWFEISRGPEAFPRLQIWNSISDRYRERIQYAYVNESEEYVPLLQSRYEVKDGTLVELEELPVESKRKTVKQPDNRGK